MRGISVPNVRFPVGVGVAGCSFERKRSGTNLPLVNLKPNLPFIYNTTLFTKSPDCLVSLHSERDNHILTLDDEPFWPLPLNSLQITHLLLTMLDNFFLKTIPLHKSL